MDSGTVYNESTSGDGACSSLPAQVKTGTVGGEFFDGVRVVTSEGVKGC